MSRGGQQLAGSVAAMGIAWATACASSPQAGGDASAGAASEGNGGAPSAGVGGGGSRASEGARAGAGDSSPVPTPLVGVGSLGCADGYPGGSETGYDCGGDCPNQDCCANGYADVERGETGVDCGGNCGSCDRATYFVSNRGDDSNDGTSPEQAWRTLAKVNESPLEAGDAVLFERGGTWRESLALSYSGNPDAYITFGAYATGAKPRILGSEQVTGWAEVEGTPGVYESRDTLDAPREQTGSSVSNHPASIFFGDASGQVVWGNMEALHLNAEGAPTDIYECDAVGAAFSLLDEEFDWCWQEGHVYVYSPKGNPSDVYSFVEVPQRVAAVRQAAHPPTEYVTLDGLELLYAIKYGYDDGWPMNVSVRGLTVRNCHVGWLGTKGAASAIGLQIWHSDMLVHNNDIHDCGRRSISYNVYGDVRDAGSVAFENVVFQHNTLHNGYHTTGFDISCGFTDTFQDFVFANNFIWDDPGDDPQDSPNGFTSMGVFLDAGSATFKGFRVYNNVLRYLKQKSIVANGLQDSQIFNNTFYSMNERAGGEYRGMLTVSGETRNLSVANNIFYGDVSPDFLVLQHVTFSGGSAEGTSMNHNLFWHAFDAQRIVDSYQMSDWDDYRAATGFDADSPVPSDPLFVDASNNDFRLQPGSPAIDAGARIDGRGTDFAGNELVGAPDIGAFEYQAESSLHE